MLMRAAFHEGLVIEPQLAQLFQNVVCREGVVTQFDALV